jgi:hypothetical protein
MQKLGALTKGDARAEAGSELGSFNFDSPLGREALNTMVANIKAGADDVPFAALHSAGLEPPGVADDAGLRAFRSRCARALKDVRVFSCAPNTLTVTRFLGRLLGLTVALQTILFEYFSQTLEVTRIVAQVRVTMASLAPPYNLRTVC